MNLHVCVLHDKTEGFTAPGDFIQDRSLKEICRRFLQVFKRNPLMLQAEWELIHVCDVDESSSICSPIIPPRVIEPLQFLGLVDTPAVGQEQAD